MNKRMQQPKKPTQQEIETLKRQIAAEYSDAISKAHQVAVDIFRERFPLAEVVFGVFERLPFGEKVSPEEWDMAIFDLKLARETAAKVFDAPSPEVVFAVWDHLFDDDGE